MKKMMTIMLALAMTAGVSAQQRTESDAQAAINNIMTRTSIRQYTNEVSKAMKLPETIVPLCTIVIGHPVEQPKPKNKWKPENVS